MKAIYFADMAGNIQQEKKQILKILNDYGINFKIKATSNPPWDEHFDVLFFDWGGLSIGNSMLQHFCHWIIEHATDHPGNVYVMTSQFTKEAMKDALSILPETPDNIYLQLNNEKTIKALSVFQDNK